MDAQSFGKRLRILADSEFAACRGEHVPESAECAGTLTGHSETADGWVIGQEMKGLWRRIDFPAAIQRRPRMMASSSS